MSFLARSTSYFLPSLNLEPVASANLTKFAAPSSDVPYAEFMVSSRFFTSSIDTRMSFARTSSGVSFGWSSAESSPSSVTRALIVTVAL